MSTIIYNDCGVTTILPLGVVCYSINSSTPDSNDGRIYLTITGGSTPYSITWSNGLKDQNIKNLIPGEYVATVVDFYGDYSATTVCTVEPTQFYVDLFADCANEYNLYLTGLTGTYDEGGVYKFTTNLGCFIYSGKTLNGDNFLSTDIVTEGPFATCDECDPPPPDLPYYPTNLCLYTDGNPFTAYPFTFYDFVNDRPSYTGTSSVSSAFTISYITTSTFNNWLVLGKIGNVLKNPSNTFNPLGGWVEEGTLNTWTAVSGSCPSAPVLSIDITTNNESCEGACNGSVTIKAKGGSGGYQYRLFNTSYQPSPTFNNLCPQTNTQVFVKDSNNEEVQGTFTILPGTKKITYKLSLESKAYFTKQDYGNQTIKVLDYVIKVSPELPDGVTINVPLYVSVEDSMDTPGSATTVYSPVLYSGTTTVSPTSNSLTSTSVFKEKFFSYRYPYSTTRKNYSVTYPTITLKKGLTVSGSVTSTITKISDGATTCNSIALFNPSNSNQSYTWVNCTGGTENNTTNGGLNFTVIPGQTVDICGQSWSPYPSYVFSTLIESTGGLNCFAAQVDASEIVSVGFNGPSISNNCTLLTVLTPQSSQLVNTLYQSLISQ